MNVYSGSKKTDFLECLSLVFLVVVLFWLSNEAIRTSIPFPLVSMIYLFWIIISILKTPKFIDVLVGNSLFLLIWVIGLIIRSIIGGIGLSYELIYAITLLMVYYIFLYYKDKDTQYKKLIFYTVIAGYLITGIFTIYYLSIDSDLVRYAGAGLTTKDSYLNEYGFALKYIGSWDYIYSLVGTVLTCLYIIKMNRKTNISKVFSFMFLFFIYIVFNASLSTAVLLLLLGLILMLMPNKGYSKILYIVLILVFTVVLIPAMEWIIRIISININNDAYLYKLNEALKIFSGEYTSFSQFYGRTDLIINSLQTFISNPMLGVYGMYPYNYISHHSVVSGHSQWIDDLARYGVVFCLFFFIGVFKISKKLIYYTENDYHSKLVKIVVAYLFILGFLNPALLIHNYLLLFIIVPFSSSVLKKVTG
jgi:hypothetical protein